MLSGLLVRVTRKVDKANKVARRSSFLHAFMKMITILVDLTILGATTGHLVLLKNVLSIFLTPFILHFGLIL